MKSILKTWINSEARAGKKNVELQAWGLGFDIIGAAPASACFTFKTTDGHYLALEVGDAEAAKMYSALKDFRQRNKLPL